MKCTVLSLFTALLFTTGALGAVAGDENWEPGFVLPPGFDGEVLAIATIGSDLYIGGSFERAGDVTVNGIARWDGTNWSALDSGVNGVVYALAVQGTNLIVGGKFDRAGSVPTVNLARWTGAQWESFGDVEGADDFSFEAPNFGAQGPKVMSLFATTNQLVVGGNFRQAGGVAATNIAAWDGTNWTAFGSGLGNLGGQIHALAEFRGQLFAGGVFLTAGDRAITNIARWSGTNWLPAGAGLVGPAFPYWLGTMGFRGVVNALAVQGNRLLAGGQLTQSGKARLINYAYWNGKQWKPVKRGVGVTNGVEGVENIAVRGKEVFVAGTFQRAGGISAPNMVRARGNRWYPMASGIGGPVRAIAFFGTNIYVGGSFGLAGGVSAAYIAYWDGTSNVWRALSDGVGNTLIDQATTLAASGDTIFAAGQIHTAGTNYAHNVAAWTGTNWLAIEPGLSGLPTSSAVAGSNYYVSGQFIIDSVRATNIAGWNGSQWFALPPLLDTNGNPARISLITARSNELFVAGNFVSAGGLPATNVVLWTGSNWVSLGDAPSVTVLAGALPMVADAGGLYVLNSRIGNGGSPEEVVYQWDGANWYLLGAPNGAGRIQSLGLFQGTLYAASTFALTGGSTSTKMDLWTGTKWDSVNWPFGQLGYVPLMAATERYLYAGGPWDFTASSSPGIARFDGANWSGLGSGLVDTDGFGAVQTIAVSGRRVIVAGFFKTAGGKPSFRFAIWNEPD